MKRYQNVSDFVLSVLPVFALKFSVSFFFAGECNQRNLITVSNMGLAERELGRPLPATSLRVTQSITM